MYEVDEDGRACWAIASVIGVNVDLEVRACACAVLYFV